MNECDRQSEELEEESLVPEIHRFSTPLERSGYPLIPSQGKIAVEEFRRRFGEMSPHYGSVPQ
jgi:hypothetical protein